MPKTYTVKDVASILGYSTNSIYTFLKEKRIKGVRVGKGRFRIPEEELSRILHLSKKTASSTVLPIITKDNQIIPEVVARTDVLDADLFDWFIGISSVISGVALFLFNISSQGDVIGRLIPVIRMLLICAGFGLVVSSIQEKFKGWHVFFQSVIASIGVMGAYGLARSFDINGVVLYGSISVVVIVTIVKKLPAEISMGYFMTLLGLGTVLGAVLWPQQAMTKSVMSLFSMPTAVVQGVFLGIVIINTSLYWIGYVKKFTWIFTISCIFFGIAFVIAAGLYGEFLYWSRSFFFMVLAFFCLFLPISQMLEPSKSQRQRLYLHLFFGGIGGIFLLALITVFSLHQALWLAREHDFENKITVGQTIIENAIANVKSSVVTASRNMEFLKGVEKNDTETLVKNSKIVYEGNSLIRRLVFLNEQGDGVAIYPYGAFDHTNYAFREYFIRVRDTKAIYISSVFATNIDQIHRPVVTVTMPLLDKKDVFRGVMNASVNLEKIALQLQQLARESGREFFTVADQNGKYVMHPNPLLLGTVVPDTDPVRKGVEKKRGIEEVILPDGTLGLVAYDTIPSLSWGISVQVPSNSVLALGMNSLVLIFGTLCGVFVLSILLLYLVKFRWLPQQRGSS